jgi:hypothetical protein
MKTAVPIYVNWVGEEGCLWSYKTDIPHETFMQKEDGELASMGIVFSMKDLAETHMKRQERLKV